MKRFLLCAALALAAPLAACHSFSELPPSPSNAANATILDERLALGAEGSYKAARVAMEFMVDHGYLKGAAAAKARTLNTQAMNATKAVRDAYDAGNKDSYIAAAGLASKAVADLLAAATPPKGSN